MPPSWILETKLVAPTPPDRWLARAALAPTAAAVTVLEAGPGYGKTLGLLAVAEQARADGALTIWYGLDELDADPATFFHYLVAGMQRHIPQFGPEVTALIGAERADARVLWQAFFRALTAYNSPGLALLLDDAHHLAEGCPALLEGLAWFFDRLPAGVRVGIASRKRLGLSLARLVAKGTARVLDQAQLAFGEGEVDAFLRARAPDGEVPAAWREAAGRLEGWPLGLDLATALPPDRTLDLAGAGAEQLTAFVTEELYLAQPEPLQAFMLRAALLQELTPEACRRVFGLADAAEQLERLRADHLVYRLASGDGYRFPPYLAEFLQAEGRRTIPGDELAAWHRAAAAHYRAAGADEPAIPHLIASAAWDEALSTCHGCFPLMSAAGRQGLIERWLDAIPAAVGAADPHWRLWRGNVAARAGAHEDARVHFDHALAAFALRGDAAGEVKVLVRQMTLAMYRQDEAAFTALRDACAARLGEGRAEDAADFHLALALAGEQTGDMTAMRAHNQAVLALPVAQNVEVATCKCIALMNLFTNALHAGDLTRAREHVEEALALAAEWKFHPYRLTCGFLRAHVHLLVGEPEAAAAFVRALPAAWEDQLDWHDRAVALTVLAGHHQARGDVAEAEAVLRRSLAIFERSGFKEGRKVPLERAAWLALQRRQWSRAAEIAATAEPADPPNVYDLAIAIPTARAATLAGDPAGAAATLARAAARADALGARLLAVRARLYEAAARAAAGETPAAEAVLAAAREAIAEHGDAFLEAQDRELWQALAALAARPARGDAASEPASPALPAAAPSRDGLLAIRCFGGLEVRQDGVLLDQWPRRKAKLVLAALALFQRGLPLEELGEVLGESEEARDPGGSLQVSISGLRKVLEPKLKKGDPSRYILLKDGRYMLDATLVGALDVREFLAAVTRGDRARDDRPLEAAAAYEEALALYRGTLLDDPLFAASFEPEREKYRQLALAMLLWLDGLHRGLGDFSAAERALLRATAIAPTDEEVYLRLAALYSERRPERVRQIYWDCRKALKQHLGVAPSERFEAEMRRLSGQPAVKGA